MRAVRLAVAALYAEALSEALLAEGALAVDIADGGVESDGENALFGEPGAGVPGDSVQFWRDNAISALFADEDDVATTVARAAIAAGLDATPAFAIDRLDDRDWLKNARDQFQPIEISPRLWIIPSWFASSQDAARTARLPDPLAIKLIFDPGLAFGSGEHPTTRLCLRWLAENIRGNESVLDYGCGSGILAIAALKLGARSAIGVDIDPIALVASGHNAAQNRVDARFCLPQSAFLENRTMDIVLANILANPLIALAPLLARSTAARGRIVLSGLLETQADEVSAAYARWFDLVVAGDDQTWVCLSGEKRAEDSTA